MKYFKTAQDYVGVEFERKNPNSRGNTNVVVKEAGETEFWCENTESGERYALPLVSFDVVWQPYVRTPKIDEIWERKSGFGLARILSVMDDYVVFDGTDTGFVEARARTVDNFLNVYKFIRAGVE